MAFINDMIKKSYAEKDPEELLRTDTNNAWYIPHHSMYHPKKPEKIPVVFDCSAKFWGMSLRWYLRLKRRFLLCLTTNEMVQQYIQNGSNFQSYLIASSFQVKPPRTYSSFSSKKTVIAMDAIFFSKDSSPSPTSAMTAINLGYNSDDFHYHWCDRKCCPSCRCQDSPDFLATKQALSSSKFPNPWSVCRFCMCNYLLHLSHQSICYCQKMSTVLLHLWTKDKHKCGWGECFNWRNMVEIKSHQCYIAPIKNPKSSRRQKKYPPAQLGWMTWCNKYPLSSSIVTSKLSPKMTVSTLPSCSVWKMQRATAPNRFTVQSAWRTCLIILIH